MNVAFLGLGAIGTPIAAHLARRESLVVWNRTEARARDFGAAHRARVAQTPREAASGAEIVITCLPTSRVVESVLEGPEGVLDGIARDALFIDCTSGDPTGSRRIAARLAERGVEFVDAPVSGGVSGAVAGSLTIMAGGEPEAFRRAKPILEAFGRRIEHVGPIGAGHALKAINNALLAVNLIAVGEALAALVKAGVPARAAVDVLNASSGRSFVTEVLVPERVLSGSWLRTFRLALLDKDVGIARALLRESGLTAPVIDVAGSLLSAARKMLGEDADHVELLRLAEREAGIEIRG